MVRAALRDPEGRSSHVEVVHLREELQAKEVQMQRMLAERDDQMRALSEEKDRKLLHMRDALIESEEQRRTGGRTPFSPASFTPVSFTPSKAPAPRAPAPVEAPVP
eukprot:648870-Prymnesium_polylepis.1